MIDAADLVAIQLPHLKVSGLMRTFTDKSEVSAIHMRKQKLAAPELDRLHLAWQQIVDARDGHQTYAHSNS